MTRRRSWKLLTITVWALWRPCPPVMFRNQPVGCTGTIMYQIYQERNLDIPQNIAGLLCAGHYFRHSDVPLSPPARRRNQAAAEALAEIAGINIQEFATEMFHAGSNLRDKSAEEIFYQDFKKFIMEDVTFGVGQINSMDAEELTAHPSASAAPT